MILLETWITQALGSSLLLAVPLAVVAGVVSFASPCVLPLLPGYLSYASGLGTTQISEGAVSRPTDPRHAGFRPRLCQRVRTS